MLLGVELNLPEAFRVEKTGRLSVNTFADPDLFLQNRSVTVPS